MGRLTAHKLYDHKFTTTNDHIFYSLLLIIMDLIHGPLGVTSMSTVGRGSPVSKAPFSLRGEGRVWIQDCLSIGLGFGDGMDNSFQCHWEILGNSPIVGLCPM